VSEVSASGMIQEGVKSITWNLAK